MNNCGIDGEIKICIFDKRYTKRLYMYSILNFKILKLVELYIYDRHGTK